jgi:uncharacterized cupin superfamily protein
MRPSVRQKQKLTLLTFPSLSNTDGSARRFGAGDTVILPKGWCGQWDVIDPVKKIWVDVQ